MQKEKDKKTTLKQEKQQKQSLLLNDINYAIDSILIDLQFKYADNLYYLYEYYINNKYEMIENIVDRIKSLKVEELQEFATNKGFEYKKVLVSKHNINGDCEYQIRLLIDDLLKDKINKLIKDYKQQLKSKEFLYNNFVRDDIEYQENKSPPKEKKRFSIMGLNLFEFIIANIIAICEAFGSNKRR